MRKSPYEHDVKSHTRRGRPVGKYRRGKGKKPRQILRKKRVVKQVGVVKRTKPLKSGIKKMFKNYRMVIYYDRTSESVLTPGKDFANATDRGMKKRKSVEPFKRIRIVGVA